VYDRLVANGSMTAGKARREIALMAEIAADYDRLAQAERLL